MFGFSRHNLPRQTMTSQVNWNATALGAQPVSTSFKPGGWALDGRHIGIKHDWAWILSRTICMLAMMGPFRMFSAKSKSFKIKPVMSSLFRMPKKSGSMNLCKVHRGSHSWWPAWYCSVSVSCCKCGYARVRQSSIQMPTHDLFRSFVDNQSLVPSSRQQFM